MAQLFRPGANTAARLMLASVVGLPLLSLLVGAAVARSGTVTGEGSFVEQQVPFSHQHHAGELGIDRRYCHMGVEKGAHAAHPPGRAVDDGVVPRLPSLAGGSDRCPGAPAGRRALSR